MQRSRLTFLASFAVVAAACETKQPSPSAAPSASASPAGVVDARGLAATTNDPAIVAAVAKALTCPWDPEALVFDGACPDLSRVPGPTTAESAATFMSLLEDPDVKVRSLASGRLEMGLPEKWSTDVVLARRLIAAAASERLNHGGVMALGAELAAVDYAATGLWPAARAALEGTPLARLRKAALLGLLYHNEANQDVWDWVEAKTAGADLDDARIALLAISRPSGHKEEACKRLLEISADDRLGGDAFVVVTLQSSRCTAFAEEMLSAVETRVEAGARGEGRRWPEGLLQFVENPDATASQRKRAAQELGSIARSPKIDPSVRVEALRDLAEVDEAQGRALAAKLAHDGDERVTAAAKGILAPRK
jgi:hypothetical protein